ncbi:MAG: isoprenyl transferase [Candidatus Eisenbacteria bacterium]|nr:isoprenyl transferase [Candidatus Eisenbacteria bacterium]
MKTFPAKKQILKAGNLPRHIAVIMDGNGRWARKRALPRIAGHRAGRKAVREVVEGCVELGIEFLTLYTFSRENWSRPANEVNALMRILERVLREEREELKEQNVRLAVLGRIEDLPPASRRVVLETVEYLSGCTGMILNLALSYGGRREIVDAARKLSESVLAGKMRPSRIDEETFRMFLYNGALPDPDLLIRTSGEMRISNFLLWQLAYSEMWITDVLWPDFRKKHLFQAIAEYQKRERRFGKVD